MWEITIKKVNNGYILEMPQEDEEGNIKREKEVIEISDFYNEEREKELKTEDEDRIALAQLLYRIADYFGFHYSGYERENLRIDFNNKGHKVYDDEDDK
jgi:hypothetical protein